MAYLPPFLPLSVISVSHRGISSTLYSFLYEPLCINYFYLIVFLASSGAGARPPGTQRTELFLLSQHCHPPLEAWPHRESGGWNLEDQEPFLVLKVCLFLFYFVVCVFVVVLWVGFSCLVGCLVGWFFALEHQCLTVSWECGQDIDCPECEGLGEAKGKLERAGPKALGVHLKKPCCLVKKKKSVLVSLYPGQFIPNPPCFPSPLIFRKIYWVLFIHTKMGWY